MLKWRIYFAERVQARRLQFRRGLASAVGIPDAEDVTIITVTELAGRRRLQGDDGVSGECCLNSRTLKPSRFSG